MPLTRCAISRASRPLKMRLRPQEMSEVSMENRAIMATAVRPFLGMVASQRIRPRTSGVLASTYPPMMIITICMVKGTNDQKLLPPAMASLAAG